MWFWWAEYNADHPALFTDSPPVPPSERRQTHVGCEQNAFLACCRDKLRNFTTISEIHEEGDEVWFGSLNR